jgi:hypothetical protein
LQYTNQTIVTGDRAAMLHGATRKGTSIQRAIQVLRSCLDMMGSPMMGTGGQFHSGARAVQWHCFKHSDIEIKVSQSAQSMRLLASMPHEVCKLCTIQTIWFAFLYHTNTLLHFGLAQLAGVFYKTFTYVLVSANRVKHALANAKN